jgi:hypothetical protein
MAAGRVGTFAGATGVAAGSADNTCGGDEDGSWEGQDRCGGDRDSRWCSQGRNRRGRNLSSGGWGHIRGGRGRGRGRRAAAGAAGVVAWAVARAALGSGYPSVRCTTSVKSKLSNSAPPQRGGGAAGGSRAAVWAAAGGVADRLVGHSSGSSGRRCGPPRGRNRAELQAASWTATAAAAVAAVSDVGIVSRESGCV